MDELTNISCGDICLKATCCTKLTSSEILRKAESGQRQLYPLLNKSSGNDINLALTVYKSLSLNLRSLFITYWSYWRMSFSPRVMLQEHMSINWTFKNRVLVIMACFSKVTQNKVLHEPLPHCHVNFHIATSHL